LGFFLEGSGGCTTFSAEIGGGFDVCGVGLEDSDALAGEIHLKNYKTFYELGFQLTTDIFSIFI